MAKRRSQLRQLVRALPLERREEVLEQLTEASSPGFDFFLLIVLSCAIATFGLIGNSIAVVIGAMLVAPLMSPILALSVASVVGRRQTFQQAVAALVEGVLIAIALAAALAWVAHALPFDALEELPSEIVLRTRPSPLDLMVALAGGAAAAYALAQPHLSATLPGVAIATALMPPLCTIGIGIAIQRIEVTFGALLLFLTNFAAISFAGIIVFALLGFRPRRRETDQKLPRGFIESGILVLSVTVPLVLFTLQFVNEAQHVNAIQSAVRAELATRPDTQLVDIQRSENGSTLNLRVTIRAARQLTIQEVLAMQASIAERLDQTVALQLIVVPTIKLDPLMPPTRTPTRTPIPNATATPAR